jgi:hypothetical protein
MGATAHQEIKRMADMTFADLKKEYARIQAENASLKARSQRAITMKVSEKGGLSLYGLGRFPVTLYHEQWTKLLAMAEDIKSFIEENKDSLKSKE